MSPLELPRDPLKTADEIFASARRVRAALWSAKPRPAAVAPPPPPPPPPEPQPEPAPEPAPPPLDAARIPLRAVVTAVCRHFDLTAAEVTSPRRLARLVQARAVGYHLAARLTSASYAEIARAFGRSDHSTVMHGIRAINEGRIRPDLRGAIEEITALLQRRFPRAEFPRRLSRDERNYNPLYPNNGKPYAKEDIDTLIRMHAEGYSPHAVGKALGRSPGTIREKGARMGVIFLRKRPVRTIGWHPRYWAMEEREELRRCLAEGQTPEMLVMKFGRSPSSIRHQAAARGFPLPVRRMKR